MKSVFKRLKAVVESDPSSLVRLLHFFQARNVVPLRVHAWRVGEDHFQVEIDVAEADLPVDVMQLIAAKIGELPVSVCSLVCDDA
jgi:hypothetical protein